MTIRQRILALRIVEKVENDPGYARKVGMTAVVQSPGADRKENKNA